MSAGDGPDDRGKGREGPPADEHRPGPRPAPPPLDDDRAVDDELAFHLDMLERELREKEGMGEDEARRAARARFGDPERVRRRVRRSDRSGAPRRLLQGLSMDLRVVLRQLRRSPGFAAAAVLSLGLGIAADTLAVSLLDGYFLRPLPYADAGRLVSLWETDPNTLDATTIAPGNLQDWKRDSRTLASIAGYNVDIATVTDPGDAARVSAAVVEPGFFDVLGVKPLLGPGIQGHDPDQVVVSWGFWQGRLGGDPAVIGRSVRVDGAPRTVVGVMPPGFRQPEREVRWARPELWSVLDYEGEESSREFRYLRAVGRLAPGATVADARDEMRDVAARLAATYPDKDGGRTVLVHALRDEYLGDAREGILLLAGAGAVVLLLVCANLAMLVLSRSEDRAREFSLRAALGSGRARLVGQVLLEALVLAAAGGALGAGLLWAGGGRLLGAEAQRLSPLVDVSLGARVLPVVVALALLTATAAGLAPALAASSPDLKATLSGTRGRSRRGGRARGALMVGELALTVVLLSTAVLLLRSFTTLVGVSPGFQVKHVVVADVALERDRYPDAAAVTAFWDRLLGSVSALPGVTVASLTSDLPFLEENRFHEVWPEGRPPAPGEQPESEFHTVAPGYFRAMGIPLLEGRDLTSTDAPGRRDVTVVNRALAARLWPGEDPVGATLVVASGADTVRRAVVGVVGDVRDDGYDAAPEPLFYVPLAQSPQRSMTVVLGVRKGMEDAAARAVRGAVAAQDPQVPVDVSTMAALAAQRTATPRDALLFVGVLALLAAVLAAVGVYGIMARAVAARTREIGIRAALGAGRRRVRAEVLARAGKLVALGAVLGLAGTVAAGRLVQGLLFRVTAVDPASYAAAVLLLAAVALAATWAPALRASRVDPMEAIRSE